MWTYHYQAHQLLLRVDGSSIVLPVAPCVPLLRVPHFRHIRLTADCVDALVLHHQPHVSCLCFR